MRSRLLLLLLLLPLLGFRLTCTQPTVAKLPKVELTYWRVFDDEDALSPTIKAYTASRPNIAIRYRKFRYEEYEDTLLNALAEDRGPDLFSIPSTWVDKFAGKLLAAPQEIVTLERAVEDGPQKREFAREKRALGPTPATIARDYVDSVRFDSVRGDAVVGLPLAVDTLALYSNPDLLSYAGISSPAKSWEDVLEHTKKLRILDKEGNIRQAAIAMGSAENVPRSPDVLLTLMLQNGTQLSDSAGHITFEKIPQGAAIEQPPAAEALRFYTDFATPSKATYTYNEQLPNGIELFRQNRLAYLLGYSYTASELRLSPKTRFTVSPMPQPQQLLDRGVKVALANTWLEVVAKKTRYPNEAWDFLAFLTSPEQASAYLSATEKPAALRALNQRQALDPFLGVFSPQTLVARSWYRGFNAAQMEASLKRAIRAVLAGDLDPAQAIHRSAQQVEQTLESNL